MFSTFDDLSIRQYDDLVSVDDGRQAVGDYKRCGAARNLDEIGQYLSLSSAVQGRSRLIEDIDARALERRTRDRDPLLLATRQFQASLADDGLVAVGQTDDEVVDVGQPGRPFDLVFMAAMSTEGDVVSDGVVEQHGVLGNYSDSSAQAGGGHAGDWHAVQKDAATVRFVELNQ